MANDVRTSPVLALQKASGARVGPVDGWLVALDFGDPGGEYGALRRGAAIVDLSLRGKLRLAGPDRARFLHNMVTNEVRGLAPGQGCNAAKLTAQGKIEGTMRILCSEDSLWCDVDPGAADAVRTSLQRHLVMEKATIEDATEAWAIVAVQGPEASRVLAAAGVDTTALRDPLQHADAAIAGAPVRVVRVDHCSEDGFDVWVEASHAAAVWQALAAAGARPAGLGALDVRRIEAGIPWFGSELTPDRFPQEAGLEAGWISYTKGCYLGQETIARIHHLGHVNWQLRGLVLEGEAPPAPGAEIEAGGARAGWVTSATLSPQLERPIALAYVRRERSEPGTQVEVAGEAGSLAARVVALPFTVEAPS